MEILFALVERNFAFAHQSPEVSVRRNIVEPMIVHAKVRNVRGHQLYRVFSAKLQKLAFASRIELQQRRSELKPLCPFSPPARGVFAFNSEYRCSLAWIPRILKAQDFRR